MKLSTGHFLRNSQRRTYFRRYLQGQKRRAILLQRTADFLPHSRRKARRFGAIYITHRLNNTFVAAYTLANKLHLMYGGPAGYRGPKRSTRYAREMVAKRISFRLAKGAYHFLDIYFKTALGRSLLPVLRGLLWEHSFFCRFIILRRMRSHGFMRGPKKRRK